MARAACTTCGGALPAAAWGLSICEASCLDAFVARGLRVGPRGRDAPQPTLLDFAGGPLVARERGLPLAQA